MIHNGLSSHEAQKRLSQYGLNALPQEKPTSEIALLLRQIKSPLIYILIFATTVSLFLREYADSFVILGAILINSFLGYYQERKAERTLLALKNVLSPQAKVIRDHAQKIINAEHIVPGDIVIVTAGDRIPADGVVIDETNLLVNEAILTGESEPVKKSQIPNPKPQTEKSTSLVFMGTTVVAGVGKIQIEKTGIETEMGKIAESIATAAPDLTPLQIKIASFARFLTMVVIAVSVGVFVTGILSNRPWGEMLTTSVAISVAAIPEGLLIALTAILALGMQRIFKHKALVRRMTAAETLGSVTVIATDKTGTLTEGQLKVVEYIAKNEKVLLDTIVYGNQLLDPLEIALWEWVEKKGLDPQQMIDTNKPLSVIPFNQTERLSASIYSDRVCVLGAPEKLLLKCDLSYVEKKKLEKTIETWGKRGLRMIGVASREIPNPKSQIPNKFKIQNLNDLQWVGIIGFEDPVRQSVSQSFVECQKAGIAIKIITGDYRYTAEHVLKKVGLHLTHPETQIMEGDELAELSDTDLYRRVSSIVLFCRATPEQKFRIVGALKKQGEIVALVGDGVNDAPALKKADIGIVVGSASDVARETADMVLLDSNFGTIVRAIEEGRGIFDNTKRVIAYLVTGSFSEGVAVILSLLFGFPIPLTAAQILWINIITDSFPTLALTVEPKEWDILLRKPSDQKGLIDRPMQILIMLISLVSGIVSFAFFVFAFNMTGNLNLARTVSFVTLGVGATVYIVSLRNLGKPLWRINQFTNPYVLAAIGFGLLVQLATVYIPSIALLLKTQSLSLYWWGVIGIGSLIVIGVIEGFKKVFAQKA